MSKRVSLSVWMMDDKHPLKNITAEVPDSLSAAELMKRLFEHAGVDDDGNYAIFIGRIIRDPEDLLSSLNELGAVPGSSVHVMRDDKTSPRTVGGVHLVEVAPTIQQSKLVFELPRGGGVFRTIVTASGELGRYDEANRDPLAVDVTSLLPVNDARVSRRQAIFREQGGNWYVRKHPRARISMYVNERLVNEGQAERVLDGDTLSIGNSLSSPALQFILRIQN